jgi:hypothetical protein
MKPIIIFKEEPKMNIEAKLNEELAEELDYLKGVTIASDEYKATIDGWTKLADRAIEMERLNSENADKERAREEERKDRLIRHCISVFGIVLPVAVTIWGTVKSFEFEKEGTITTLMGKGFMNKLLPKK